MAEATPRWDFEVDVVAAGSGLGALTAAIVAHDAGAEVAIFEKAAKLGGVCAYSGGEVFVPCNHKMAAEGSPDDPAAARAYLDFLAGGYAAPHLQTVLFETGHEAARYLEEHARVRWKTIRGFPDYHYPVAPGTVAHGRYLEVELYEGARLGPWQKKTYLSPHVPFSITHDELFAWGSLSCILQWDFALMGKRIREDVRGFGPGMMGYFIEAALVDRAIPAHLESPVREVLVEGGRAIGVRVEHDRADIYVRARRGVVLAVGGYDGHPDLPRYHEGLPEWHTLCQPSIEGDNMLLGGDVGAALAGVPAYNLGMFFGYHVPGEEHDGAPLYRASWEGGYPHALWVNRKGERFCDESFYRDYLPRCHQWDGTHQTHPNLPPFLIFDSRFRSRYAMGPFLPGQPLPDGLCAQADTPRELASQLGIDPDGLAATLDRFNSFADGEVDPDFGRGTYPWAAMMTGDSSRPNPNLGPVCEPPLFGLALVPVGVGINAVGLRTNEHAQVMHVRGHAIEGLYAVGNAAAALDTGAGYQSGLSNLRGMTWGYVAGRHAAGGS